MDVVSHFKLVDDYIAALVHPSVTHNLLLSARHRIFIASRLVSSVIMLGAFPIYIILLGAPNTLEVFVFVWSIAPISIAYYLSRTGQYESAQLLSAIALLGFGTIIAGAQGGVGSFAAVWFVIVPLEAALSMSSRVVMFASTLTFGAAGSLWLGVGDMIPIAQSSSANFAALGMASAILYSVALAFGAHGLLRTSSNLLNEQSDRYRLLAGNVTEVITRHDRNGVILSVSQTAESLFGAPAKRLIGHGLLNRVHVADRPAYLTALGDAAAYGQARSVEIRARRDSYESGQAVHFIWIEMYCRPVGTPCNPSDSPPEVITVIRDITERKARDRTIETMAAQIEQAALVHTKLLAIIGREQTQILNSFTPPQKSMVKKSA
jgi:two-component system, cell cycle sensor histidine kinase DivJ